MIKRRRTILLVGWGQVILLASCMSGCANNADGLGGPSLFRGSGEDWTILCMTFQGPDRKSEAERVSDVLKHTPQIDPKRVFVGHDQRTSQLYYGKYFREMNTRTRKLSTPANLVADTALIKDLGNPRGGGRFFLEARAVPMPTPDVGNPAWKLSNNKGTYSLLVAIFFVEPGFKDRKKAAAAYCEELRKQGYEAWYHHGERTSEVTVGTFGANALVQVRRRGVLVNVHSDEVKRLQARSTFQYELRNGRPVTVGQEGQAVTIDATGKKAYRASRLIKVRRQRDFWDEEY